MDLSNSTLLIGFVLFLFGALFTWFAADQYRSQLLKDSHRLVREQALRYLQGLVILTTVFTLGIASSLHVTNWIASRLRQRGGTAAEVTHAVWRELARFGITDTMQQLVLLGILTVFLTAFYSFRLVFVTFWGPTLMDQHARAGSNGLALPATSPLTHYVFEANLRMHPGSSSGAAGVTAYYRDNRNRIDARLERSRRVVSTAGVLDGRVIPEQTTALPEDFRFDVYHQLLVSKNGNVLRVSLDGTSRGPLSNPPTCGTKDELGRQPRPAGCSRTLWRQQTGQG